MTTHEPERYDFDAASRVKRNLRTRVQSWFDKSAYHFPEAWAEVSRAQVSARCAKIDALPFAKVQGKWTTAHYGFLFQFTTKPIAGMVCVRKADLMVLVMDVLGGGGEPWTGGSLSNVEAAIGDLVFERLIANLGDAWPEQETLVASMDGKEETPNRCRTFSPAFPTLICDFAIRLNESDVRFEFILDLEQTRTALDVPSDAVVDSGELAIAEAKLNEFQIELVAELGHASIDMEDLATIKSGDIIVLSQMIDETIKIRVKGQPMFEAWPGRSNDQRVVQIANCIDLNQS